MRRMTKLLLALPLIAGTTLATLPAAEAHPGGGWGRPGWGGPPPPPPPAMGYAVPVVPAVPMVPAAPGYYAAPGSYYSGW
ncbi:hypothetical protein [Acetobacter malorum]|uniref:hypothetical protein n=1 Tax=Acetobacter malorum TaxID=178901 RepID=UPI0039E98F92